MSAPSVAEATKLNDAFASTRESFARARRACGSTETQLTIADRGVSLVSCPPRPIRSLARAFGHLRSHRGHAPTLTIHVWDSASTKAPPPLLPSDLPGLGAATTDGAGAFYYAGGSGLQIGYQPVPDALSMLDSAAGTAWYWTRDFTRLPYWDCATPLRHLMHWWLREQGLFQVHGAAVGTASGGVLLVGKGASGKSTSTLACLGSKLLFAGDDYVAVEPSQWPWVYSLYGSAKLVPDDIARFPRLVPELANGDRLAEEKAVFYLDGSLAEATIPGFPLQAILLPTVTGTAQPRLVEASAAMALRALAPTTIFQLHPPRADALQDMARFVQSLPAFVLELGPDIAAIPGLISRLLDELEGEGV